MMNHDEKIKALERVRDAVYATAGHVTADGRLQFTSDYSEYRRARAAIDALLADAKANVPRTTEWRGGYRKEHGHDLRVYRPCEGNWSFSIDFFPCATTELFGSAADAQAACDKAAHELVFGKGTP